MRIGVIGGSGFHGLLEDGHAQIVETPFGASPRIEHGTIEDVEILFLHRHGKPGNLEIGHTVPPHKINYKANIFALHKLGVTRIIASSAVGIVNNQNGTIKPGHMIVPNQIIDFTDPITFFDGSFSAKVESGRVGKGVVHVDVTNPICSELITTFVQSGQYLKVTPPLISQATYMRLFGPRFETAAEITALKHLGATIVGMTMSKEAFLARELEICYANACIGTNYAAGLQAKITHDEVVILLKQQVEFIKDFFRTTIVNIPESRNCECSRALERSI